MCSSCSDIAVLGDQINAESQVDDNFFSDVEMPSFSDLMDICMSSPEICMVDSAFGDNDDFNVMCCDEDLSATNSVCAMDATDSHYEASGEQSQQMSDYMSSEYTCHQTMPTQNLNANHSQIDFMEIDNYDTEAFDGTLLDIMTHESNSLPTLVGTETSKKKHTLCLDLDGTWVKHLMFSVLWTCIDVGYRYAYLKLVINILCWFHRNTNPC